MQSESFDRVRDAVSRAGGASMVAAYLFGSAARGEMGPASDIDVGVLFADVPPSRLDHPSIRLAGDLEAVLGLPVQVIVLNDAPPDLTHRVLRDGRLLVDRDPALRIRFEVKARNEYFDLLPFLERYRTPSRAPR